MLFNGHKKVVQDLQHVIAQQASLLEAIDRSMAIIEFDITGVVLSANNNFLSAMRYRKEDLIGKEHRHFCTSEYVRSAEYAQLWARLRAGDFVTSTFRRVAGDGEPVWLEASYSPVKDASGKVVKIVKYAMDVTEKVQLENEAKNRLQAIDRAMVVIEFEPNGQILTANENFLKRMGYSLGELKGKHHRLFCPPEIVNSTEYEEFWRRLNKGEFFNGQFKRMTKNGQTVWLEASYNPVYDASGKLSKVIKFASDITDRVVKHEQDAHSAAQAYHISIETQKVAEEGTRVIQQAASEMRQISLNIEDSSRIVTQLGERSDQITAIVNTIRSIADQTNLLALNAAIEAARAGDQGRGFAVVADEVRQLAGRTSRSTAEISEMIQVIQTETQLAISSMDNTRSTASRGVELADQAGSVIVQISAGASEAVAAVKMFAGLEQR
ncbi:methyl-accepting chemotaxis protein [Pseudomonas sp. CCI3.2]|uniref:methyl-accepting chemotaxis protein n=1 Tax=unclassified Pseudomonas TaxID=196821 RepID=UPI002AC8FD91|nr:MULTISPECIES: methyl-accepting chemotaxis protein [unclassified Pseudomonas]MEB0079605.1 methyl-accepting chemotaxis protein [Pseudomonas sp. MH10out]MEB0102702.1 methyl-accepting chemotaxis protein [Pseudomonas sp. CCI3.2]MEB0132498.1 methyl-accepting chemotaxis protein [Pseudomonas sp. CCI2.4]MEB0160346.1 methyl-accepting chemotaxis protein [Pseudomonas sp. AH2 (2023)]MEB0169268.1 methyl-accepting chemotaxis protein [Pseudomonas sp. CCC4.4]